MFHRSASPSVPAALRVWALAALSIVAAAACSADGARAPGAVRVVTTTALLAEFAREIAGTDAEVSALIPPGTDPHSFEAPTQAARVLAAADVIVVNGYRLEGGLLEVIAANRRTSSTVIVAAAGIPALAAETHESDSPPPGGLPAPAADAGDPHMWLDPDLAAKYAENIARGLAAGDPTHAEGYRARGDALATRLRALKAEITVFLAAIPSERRRIVVFHDAFAYFARAFDFQLAAGVLPAEGGREPSARALADTVALVRGQAVPAVFGEPQFPTAIVEAIARDTGARVLVLYSDAYGAGIEDYTGLMRANARALVEGLGAPGAR